MTPFTISILFIVAWLVAFGCIWFVMTGVSRRRARMAQEVPLPAGSPIRESAWGSAFINGVSASNSVKVIEYEGGWLFKRMPMFGGGMIWMPRDGTTVGDRTAPGYQSRVTRTLRSSSQGNRL